MDPGTDRHVRVVQNQGETPRVRQRVPPTQRRGQIQVIAGIILRDFTVRCKCGTFQFLSPFGISSLLLSGPSHCYHQKRGGQYKSLNPALSSDFRLTESVDAHKIHQRVVGRKWRAKPSPRHGRSAFDNPDPKPGLFRLFDAQSLG